MERQSYIDTSRQSPEFAGYGFDLVQPKMDGQWAMATVSNGRAVLTSRSAAAVATLPAEGMPDCVLVGEYMASGTFWAFDAPYANGDYCERLAYARRMVRATIRYSRWAVVPTGPIALADAYWRAVLANNGEGLIYRRSGDAYFEGAAIGREKRVQTWDGESAGTSKAGVPVFDFEGVRQAIAGVPADECRPGRVAEFSAFARFASGKLRNPVFLRWRDDKSA